MDEGSFVSIESTLRNNLSRLEEAFEEYNDLDDIQKHNTLKKATTLLQDCKK